jgi:hypothetical protein
VVSDELKASWQRSERYLAEAVAQPDLASDMRAMALDFIAHNEFGVAFEYLTSVLAETDAELTQPVRQALARAASETSLEDNPGLEEIVRLLVVRDEVEHHRTHVMAKSCCATASRRCRSLRCHEAFSSSLATARIRLAMQACRALTPALLPVVQGRRELGQSFLKNPPA